MVSLLKRNGAVSGVAAGIVGLAVGLARGLEMGSRRYCWSGGRVSERVTAVQRNGTVCRLPCGPVAKRAQIQILKGVPKSLARLSDLGTFGSFLVPMYGVSLQVSAGGVFVEAKRCSF